MQFAWRDFLHIDSTQTYAHDYIASHILFQPLLVTSVLQKSGYGTKNNMWESPAGNLYATFCFKPQKSCDQWAIEVAHIVQHVVKKLANVALTIKHPNDLLFEGKKCSGILCTWATDLSGEDVLCVGIGFNCKTAPETTQPTSVVKCDKNKLISMIIEQLLAKFAH